MTTSIPKKHILLEPYCIFCRSTIKYRSEVLEAPEPWEEDVLGFFEIANLGMGPTRTGYLIPLETNRSSSVHIGDKLHFELSQAGFQVIYDPEVAKYNPEHTANCVHVPCLQYAMTKLPRLSIRSLCQIARALRPIMAWQNTGHLRSEKKECSGLPSLSDLTDTSLGLFLHATMKRLPVELVGMITQCVGDGLFSSLLMTSETLAWIRTIGFTRITKSENYLSKKQVFSVHDDIQHLGLNSIQVMGEHCLVELQYDPKVCRSQIPVAKKQIKGLQFGLGFHGVLGLRIVYVDDSSSPWLGQKSPKWIRSIRGSDLTKLRMVFDGLKILSFTFESEDEVSSPNETCVIWDHDMGIMERNRSSLIDTSLFGKFHVRGNPNTRYGLFLPFRFNDGKPHSLTVFCSPYGLCCIQVDGDPKQRLGAPYKRSSAITFYHRIPLSYHAAHPRTDSPPGSVSPGTLLSTSLICRTAQLSHALQAKTSTGRYLYYGFYISPALEVTGAHVSTYSLNNRSASVVGIFADPATANMLLLRTIGVVTELNGEKAETDPEPVVNSIEIPVLTHIERDSFAGLYLETAMVNRAAFAPCVGVKMQKRGSRCIGLLAETGSATIILGQWDPSQVNCIRTLYSQKDDVSLECITFVFSDGTRTRRYVEDIILNDTNRTERNFVWDNLNKELAWYFTSEYDHLGYWDGASLQMNTGKSALPNFPVVN